MFEQQTILPVKSNPFPHYSRHDRRKNAFVIVNRVNGLYVKREILNKKLIYSDVELQHATGFKWSSINYIIDEMLSLNPTLDLTIKLAYRDPKTRKICVR